MITTSRRKFLIGAAALVAAPSIVRADSLMPVRGIVMDSGLGPVVARAMTLQWVIASTKGSAEGATVWTSIGGQPVLVEGDTLSVIIDKIGTAHFEPGQLEAEIGDMRIALVAHPPND